MIDRKIRQPHKTQPPFFYGYIVVIAAFSVMAVSFAVFNTFGVFFKPLLDEFGWTSAVTSGAFSLSMIIYGVLGIVMGGLNDRFGPRVVLTFCSFIIGLGYLLMSRVNALWQFYLFYGVMIGVGMSGVWVPLLSSVARWFVGRRNVMTGIVIAGTGIGSFIGPPVINWLIANYEWRPSFIILGGVSLVLIFIAAQFLRRDPAQMGQLPYGVAEGKQEGSATEANDFSLREAVTTPQFWLTFMMFLCYGFGLFTVLVHIVRHAIELEISAATAANILAVSGGVGVVGNYLLGGIIGDRIGNRRVFIIGGILMSATLFWLVSAGEAWMLYLFSIVFGFALGGIGAGESPLVARLFGLGSHGLIYGVAHLGFTVGAAVGPVVTGYIFDITGDYQMAFLLCAALSVVGVILVAILRPTRRMGGSI